MILRTTALVCTLALAAGLPAVAAPPTPSPTAPIDVANRLQLFVDEHLIDRMEGQVRLKLHHPRREEIVVEHDAPWEGNLCGYHTVFEDDGIYRMYYRAWNAVRNERGRSKPNQPMFTCYAESPDGIHWTKPVLGLIDFEGSKKNNIILREEGKRHACHNFAPFKDANPDAPPEARYKALGGHFFGLLAFQSPDGIHWEKIQEQPVLTDGAFDSQNIAFWDPVRHEYRAYFRDFTDKDEGPRLRAIKTAASKDFIHWSEPTWLIYPGAPQEHLYTSMVQPYDRAPELFIGFPTRYLKQRSSLVVPGRGSLVEPLFMSSRDGITFRRWPEAIIRPGRNRDRWRTRSNYAWWGLVETESALPGNPRELSLYTSERYATTDSTCVRRYTYRPDGFVSLHAPYAGGTIITKPLRFEGNRLLLNFATSAAGSIVVELLDATGNPIPGMESRAIYGDDIAQEVAWRKGADVGALGGTPVQVKFTLTDADLYALRFETDQ